MKCKPAAITRSGEAAECGGSALAAARSAGHVSRECARSANEVQNMGEKVSSRSVRTLLPDSFRTLLSHSERTPFALPPHFDRTPPTLHLHVADSLPNPVRTSPALRARIDTLRAHSIPSRAHSLHTPLRPSGHSFPGHGRSSDTPRRGRDTPSEVCRARQPRQRHPSDRSCVKSAPSDHFLRKVAAPARSRFVRRSS